MEGLPRFATIEKVRGILIIMYGCMSYVAQKSNAYQKFETPIFVRLYQAIIEDTEKQPIGDIKSFNG